MIRIESSPVGVCDGFVHAIIKPSTDKHNHQSYLPAFAPTAEPGNATGKANGSRILNESLNISDKLSQRLSVTPPNLHVPPDAEAYTVSLEDCLTNSFTVQGTEGVISGLFRRHNETTVTSECQWGLEVPENRYVVLLLDVLDMQGLCGSLFEITMSPSYYVMNCTFTRSRSPVLFFRTNSVTIKFTRQTPQWANDQKQQLVPFPTFKIAFKSTTETLWYRMVIRMTSSKSGLVTSPGFDVTRSHGPFLEARHTLIVPTGHVVMISFPYFDLVAGTNVVVIVLTYHSNKENRYFYEDYRYLSAQVIDCKKLAIIFMSSKQMFIDFGAGLNLSFSFHPQSAAPVKLDSGLFDCSVAHYSSFQHHLHCNLQPECQTGEDEGAHCPFSSSECQGRVDAGDKCFFRVRSDHHQLSWSTARAECQAKGGDLAVLKNDKERRALWTVYSFGRNSACAYVGLYYNDSVSHFAYVNTWTWLDDTVDFYVNVTYRIPDLPDSTSRTYGRKMYVMAEAGQLRWFSPREAPCLISICETKHSSVQVDDTSLQFLTLTTNVSLETIHHKQLITCLGGHFVHLSADWCCDENPETRIQCPHPTTETSTGSHNPELANSMASAQVANFAKFKCEDGSTLLYSLVCDFMHDCSDGSDETFCQRDQCGFGKVTCSNGQCISAMYAKDLKRDCLDGSDVSGSSLVLGDFTFSDKKPGPSILHITSSEEYTQTPIASSQPCPHTHFRCPHSHNCLPVFLICNGFNDCAQHEDEDFCDKYTCSGFYRCRKSRTCLHVSHLCDGIAHCEWQDDEMLCDVSCPQHCHCQAHSFVCIQKFPAGNFPQLRYLDASRSMMSPDDLASHSYLIYLKLTRCGLRTVKTMTLPNLQFLDFSWNKLEAVNMDVFSSLKQLKILLLKGNPLTVITGGDAENYQHKLTLIELSHTRLSSLSADVFQMFLFLQIINTTFSQLTTITKGFQFVSYLQQLDLRGNPIKNYPRDMFKALTHIKRIYADDYKLCCPGMLPKGAEDLYCFALQDELSSCEDLLFSDLYRAFLWLMAITSVVGNTGCFLMRNFVFKSRSASGFNVFVSSLSMADCLMGVYLVCIGVADQVYRGRYYIYENVWLSSIPCRVLGVLSLLSSEVSALTIWFITLDRFLVLRFPFSTVRFTKWSAAITCVLTWALGLCLCVAPLLVSHWDFYGQKGICIPLPVTKQDFAGQDYSFGLMIVLNFILLLMIAVGQMFIYHSVRSNSMTLDTSRKQQDVTVARRLITVALSDFFCWFPIGLLGLLSSAGVPIPGEVNVSMSIFVLPLNSSLNPFLYTFNMLMERRRKEKENRILKYLEASLRQSSSSAAVSEAGSASHDLGPMPSAGGRKEDMLRGLHEALKSNLVTLDNVRTFLSSLQNRTD